MADIPRPYSPFFDSMFSSQFVLRVIGFTTINMIKKMQTLCNENNYENENKKTYNMKHHVIQRCC